MMYRLISLAVIYMLSGTAFAQSIPPIGQWREHLPWNNAIQVAVNGSTIVAATPYAMFFYNPGEGSFIRRSKVNGLHDIHTSAMAVDQKSGKTILAYRNGNVDVITTDDITNIPDLRISSVQGDKTVNRIIAKDNKAWLSTGLGVVLMDLDQYEVKSTWRPSASGSPIPVFGLAFYKDSIYVACSEGVRKLAARDDGANFKNWTTADPALTGKADHVLSDNNNLYVIFDNRILKWNGRTFSAFYSTAGKIISADIGTSGLLVSEIFSGAGRVLHLSESGSVIKIFQPPVLSYPEQALLVGSDAWIADRNNGLIRVSGNEAERVFPNSPINTASGEMKFIGNTLWAAAGSVNEAWNYQFNPNGLYRFQNEKWDGYNLYVYPKIDSLLDFVTITGQATTGSVYGGSYGGGLLEITKDGKLNIYKQNSPIQSAIGDPGSYRVSGLATDAASNVWISNFGAPNNILVKKADGRWLSFSVPFFHIENAVSQITIDSYDQKWIVSPKGNGLFLLNSGASIDNTGDDRWRYFRQGKTFGNLPSNIVFCTVQDKNGFIWVGTGKGIAVITCGQDAVNSNCDAVIPVVKQDNFAGYLFQDEEVLCMAVDGANRKWVGTRNGLWLISEEGDNVLYQFTTENSPLLANEINSLAVDPITGELFVATASGICSFRGTATAGGDTKSNVLVYPNPVPSGYGGIIGIRGLPDNSLVRITELDGRLVYQTRSQGGQATWNGKDYKGNRMASGAYLVLVSDGQNQERMVTKIFFIR